MNKSDKLLIIILIPILLIVLLIFKLTSVKSNKIANVYYENEVILKINLEEEKEYVVKGYNGDVKIKAGNGKIKVVEETSEKHLCSKQGYIKESYETIVCLPNKIVIKITSDDELDATL